MKLQEIFDAAAAHLMGMEGPAVDQENDACVYRGRDADCEFNGQMCAVGFFIADKHYEEYFEGQGISDGQGVAEAVAKSWGQDDLTDDQLSLLAHLQIAHDDTSRGILADDLSSWSRDIVTALDDIANKFHLRFDPKGASA